MEASNLTPSDEARPPLFRNVIYPEAEKSQQITKEQKLEVPVIAFHSYKGGVGRTLSALSLVREFATPRDSNEAKKVNKVNKILLVDADPLSWRNFRG